MEFIALVLALAVLFFIHMRWGQYIVDPSRRTRDHVRSCEECRRRLLALPPKTPQDVLCPVGAELFDKYGAWS